MINIDSIEIILNIKKNELSNMQNDPNTNQVDIDNLEKEINYLEALLIRYKIAGLLNLTHDKYYSSHNYIGIEEEAINDFNLSSEDIAEYNRLVSLLPTEQIYRYKIRRHMAEVVGNEVGNQYQNKDYEGIEVIDPNKAKYSLNSEQIREFNSLKNQLNNVRDDTTKSVDLEQETLKALEVMIAKLDIEDVREYNRVKIPYMRIIDKLVNSLPDASKKNVFTNISNYELVLDLSNTYQNIPVEMNMTGVERLMVVLRNGNLPDDKYNEYLDLLGNNVNRLYQDDDNKEHIEGIINSVNRDDYVLRNDLDTKLSNIENIRLKLEDNELEDVFDLLNENYDSLDEAERDKIFRLLETKIASDIGNLDKINEINGLFLSVTNKNFERRLQTRFSSNKNAEFSNQHLMSYQDLVQDRIKKLEAKKSKYASKNAKTDAGSIHNETRVKAIEAEIERLKGIDLDYKDNLLIGEMDSKYNEKTEKVIALEKEIAELKELREQLNSKLHQKVVSKKIDRRNKKINKLRKSQVKIVGSQKKVMAPKLILEQRKERVNRHFEAKTDILKDFSEDYTKMAEKERNLNGFFSNIKAEFYEFKAGRYESKAEFNQRLCEMLRNGRVRVTGSNERRMNPDTLDQIRQQQQQQVATQTM